MTSTTDLYSEALSKGALALGPSQGLDLTSLTGIPVLLPTQQGFKDAIKTWSRHHQPTEDQQTRAVFRPETEADVSRIVNWAREGGYKITPKSGGVGGACGRGGMCLDMSAFNKVELDIATETCALGPGQRWVDVNAKLRDTGYSVIGARTPMIGVGGFLLIGGFSWLSHEYGIGNDPQNLLGATVVLADGRIIHARSDADASEKEKDIMFALRGGGGNFGAVTEFKVKAVKTPTNIYTGRVFYSLDQFPALAPLIANFLATNPLPSSGILVLIQDVGPMFGDASYKPMVHVVIYDALGATHARTNPSSAGGFSWLWDKSIKGGPKAEMLEECTYEDAVNVQAPITKMFGMTRFILDAVTPWHGEMDEELLGRCLKWFENTVETLGEEEGRLAFVLLEPVHPAAFKWGVKDADTAWPRAKAREVIQIGIMFGGVDEDADEEEKKKMRESDRRYADLIKKAAAEIPLGWRPTYPNYGDAAAGYTIADVYGPNLPRLREIKRKYDPQSVFMSVGLRIPPATA